MALFRRNIKWEKGLRGPGFASIEYYGAKGGAGNNDLSAFNQAINDLALTKGTLYLGPKAYRIDGSLVMKPGVSIVGVPEASCIVGNHATQPLLRMTNGSTGLQFTTVENVAFGSLIGATGSAISNEQPNQKWRFVNCSWNSPAFNPLLNGAIFSETSSALPGCVYQFDDCWAQGNRDGTIFGLSNTGSFMNFNGGKYLFPAAFGNLFFYYSLGSGVINGTEFDAVAHASGSNAACIGASSSAGSSLLIDNVRAWGTGGPAKVVLSADSGVLVRCTNLLNSVFSRYSTGTLASGSYLEMLPHQSLQTSGAAVTIPDNVESFSCRIVGSPTVNPTLTMPAGNFPGRELEVWLRNDSGDAWTGILFTPVDGGVIGSLPNGSARTFRFRYMSPTGSTVYKWVLMGDPSPTITPA